METFNLDNKRPRDIDTEEAYSGDEESFIDDLDKKMKAEKLYEEFRDKKGLSKVYSNKDKVDNEYLLNLRDFSDEEKELLDHYLHYLSENNEYGLELNETELSNLEEEEKQELKKLYEEKDEIYSKIMKVVEEIKNKEEEYKVALESKATYSTENRHKKGHLNEIKDTLEDLKNESKELHFLSLKNKSKIQKLENIAFSDPDLIAFKKKPDYSEADLKAFDLCLDYSLNKFKDPNYNYEIHINNEKQSESAIIDYTLEALQKASFEGKLGIEYFSVNKKRKPRQLSHFEKFFDKKTKQKRRAIYVYNTPDLLPGKYAFKIKNVDIKEGGLAIVDVDLVLNVSDLERKKMEYKKKKASNN